MITGFGFDIKNIGLALGLKDKWPYTWCRRQPALLLASKTTGLGLGLNHAFHKFIHIKLTTV